MWNDIFLNIDVNKKAIRLFGIETAVYFSELSRVVKRVIEKGTADQNGFFPLDRGYIEKEIGLTREQQYNCDSILIRNQILANLSDDRDHIAVDLNRWVGLITSEDTKLIQETVKKSILPKSVLEKNASNARGQAKRTSLSPEAKKVKEEGIKENFRRICMEQPISKDENVLNSLFRWVDSIYDSKNFLTRAAVEIFCQKLGEFSTDPKIRVALIDIAAARAYKDFTFVADVYARSCGKTSAVKPAEPQKIATKDTVSTTALF